jgi:putative flippase GtrA
MELFMNFIVIPSLNPTDKLTMLVDALGDRERIILVDDGSKDKRIFDNLRKRTNVFVLTHPENYGKGEAIKTAAAFVSENFPEYGIVTADDDGQHTPEDIFAVKKALRNNPGALVLGVRDFSGKDVPRRSRFGNKSTSLIFKIRTGRSLSDTQTGLRGIPAKLIKHLTEIPGSRFEYEITMLTDFSDRDIPFVYVPIKAVYSTGARKSYYKTFSDSVRVIGGILYRRKSSKVLQFSKFGVSGILSAAVDVGLYYLLSFSIPVLAAAYIARLVSGIFNFSINRFLVFSSNEKTSRSAVKYLILFAVQLVLTANLTDLLVGIGANILLSKIAVDLTLFTLSFIIQRRIVFKNRSKI